MLGPHDLKREREKIQASEPEKEISVKSEKSKKNEENSCEKIVTAELKHHTGKTEKLMEKAIINGKQKRIENYKDSNPKEKQEIVKNCRKSMETGVNKRGEITAFSDKGPKKRTPVDKRKIVIEYDDLFKPDVLITPDKVGKILKTNNENKKESKDWEKESAEFRNKINTEGKTKKEMKMKQNKERLEVKVREGNQQINGKNERKDLDEKPIITKEKTEQLIKGDIENMDLEVESMRKRDVVEKQIDEERIDQKVEDEESKALQVSEEEENGKYTCTSTIDYQDMPGDNCRTGEKSENKAFGEEGNQNEKGISEENPFCEETFNCYNPEREKNDPATNEIESEQVLLQKAALEQISKENKDHKERGEKESKKDKRERHDQGQERAKNIRMTDNSNALKEEQKKRHKREEYGKEVHEKEVSSKNKDKESKEKRSKDLGDKDTNNCNLEEGNHNLWEDQENTGKWFGARNEYKGQIEDKNVEEQKECNRKDEKKGNECGVTEMEERSSKLNQERCSLDDEENNEIKDEYGTESLPNQEESIEKSLEFKPEVIRPKEENMEKENNASENIDIKSKDGEKGENRSEEETNKDESKLKGKEKKKKKKNKEKEKTNKISKETKSKTHQKLKVKLSYEMDKKRKKKRDGDDPEKQKKNNEMDVNHEGKKKSEKESENISHKRKIKEDGEVKAKKPKTEESSKVKKAQEDQKWKW
ncbi:hypothetical protein NDU88_003977 [Pleurodeles waltl]|uniref:Uncharacterized protein n=1 Tax=Pleurodeles waltl TaxID=8319 RepID=A0AAV7V1M7_PLEWA|nr:hypothetical protein NDU88_003977 [Pleurodeles waltl]